MIQAALNVFKLPYIIDSKDDIGNYTLYHLKAIGSGATLNRLKARLDDIKAYTGQQISVQSDINGVSLRVEKQDKETYLFEDYNGYLNNYPNYKLPFMIGLTENGVVVDDLAKCPHLLIAGTTGSGKSSYLHTLILSLMYKNCGLFLVDCKRVEFSVYEDRCNVCYDVQEANTFINFLIEEIERRYKAMQQAGVNTFEDYKQLNPDTKYFVLVVDELADLISTKQAQKNIVPKLLRIAQIGRAAGVHMVLATQRPDTSVINGTLKGNIPTRISFNVASRFDSQVVLDRSGAENLNGNGDGLYLKNGQKDLIRFQSTYISMEALQDWAK